MSEFRPTSNTEKCPYCGWFNCATDPCGTILLLEGKDDEIKRLREALEDIAYCKTRVILKNPRALITIATTALDNK